MTELASPEIKDVPLRSEDEPRQSRTFLVLTGPTGVGKDETRKKLIIGEGAFKSVVTATTRPQAPHEVGGEDYHFITREQFERLRDQGKLLEWVSRGQYLYGTPISSVKEALATGGDVVLRIDPNGAARVIEMFKNEKLFKETHLVVIYLTADLDALGRRISGRGREKRYLVIHRLLLAKKELKRQPEFAGRESEGIFVVENKQNQHEECVRRVREIIAQERIKASERSGTESVVLNKPE